MPGEKFQSEPSAFLRLVSGFKGAVQKILTAIIDRALTKDEARRIVRRLGHGRIVREPRPFDRGLAFIRPLRRRAALVVEYAPGLIERPVLVLGNRVLSDRVDENLHADNRVRLTSHDSILDATLIEKLAGKGIQKFIGYEIPIGLAKQRYGAHFSLVEGDVRETDDLRVLDYDGSRAFKLFRFSELGSPLLHEPG